MCVKIHCKIVCSFVRIVDLWVHFLVCYPNFFVVFVAYLDDQNFKSVFVLSKSALQLDL